MAQKNPIKELKDTLQQICCQLQEDQMPHEVTEGFILEEFLRKLVCAVKEIDNNAKRICYAFAEPSLPSPREVASLMACMKKACMEVLVVFAELPRCQGRTLRKEVVDQLHELYDAVKDFISGIGSERNSYLQAAAKLERKCEAITNTSKDNKEAVCSVLGNNYDFIGDAFYELRQSIAEDEALAVDVQHMPVGNGLNQPHLLTWSEQDRALVISGMGLVKTVRITMRKVYALVKARGRCINMQENADLDRIAHLFRTSSSFMDNFIASLYPPIVAAAVQENGAALKGHVLAILEATKQVYSVVGHCRQTA